MLILEAISNCNSDPESLSQLARGSLVKKVEQLRRALKGSVGQHQIAMIGYQVRHIRFLNEEIKRNMQHAEEQILHLDEIPGIGRRSAERILAETGIGVGLAVALLELLHSSSKHSQPLVPVHGHNLVVQDLLSERSLVFNLNKVLTDSPLTN